MLAASSRRSRLSTRVSASRSSISRRSRRAAPIDDVGQLLPLGAELPLAVLLEELGVALHHADRLLELVRGHRGELQQLLVGAPELRRLPGHLVLGLPCGR